jgi:hypothetical protein
MKELWDHLASFLLTDARKPRFFISIRRDNDEQLAFFSLLFLHICHDRRSSLLRKFLLLFSSQEALLAADGMSSDKAQHILEHAPFFEQFLLSTKTVAMMPKH